VLRGKSVSRIPDLAFLADRVRMEAWRRREHSDTSGGDELPAPIDRASVNPTKGYYVLNPSGDLKGTEERLRPWVKDMKSSAGWSGIVGRVPSEQEFLDALERRELVV
jgi:separase